MKLDIIENSGPDNLRDTLRFHLARASNVAIAVAFITQAGLDEIVQPLRQASPNGRIRLLTGLYQKFTEPQALRALLQIEEQTRGRLSVRLSCEPQFHRKLYLLSNRTHTTAILGSSNLTREGLRSGGELNLMVRLPTDSPVIRKIHSAFDGDWEHRAVPLTHERLTEYEKCRPETPNRESLTNAQLKMILRASPSHRGTKKDSQEQQTRFWRDCICGIAAKRTQQIISETTNWDDRGYWWYSTGGAHPYRNNDHILLFDFVDKHFRWAKVKDIAQTKVATPDGQHFVAYKPLSSADRRFSKTLWAALKGEGIKPTDARKRRKLSVQKADRLRSMVRSRRKQKTR